MEEKGKDMSKHSPASNRIPSILAIPDRLKTIRKKLLAIRIPRERQFYGWAALLLLLAGLLIVLFSLIRPLRAMRGIALAAAAVLSLPVIVLDGLSLIRRKIVPLEEIILLLAAAFAVLTRDLGALAAILMSAAALREVEGYAQLHRDAVLDGAQEERMEIREQLHQCDVEKSETGAVLMPAEVALFALFLLLSVIQLLAAAFHPADWAKWLGRAAVCLVLASPSAAVCIIVLNHFGIFSSIARHGIVFSDDRVPEEYRQCRLFAFSKTGTVTDGAAEGETKAAGETEKAAEIAGVEKYREFLFSELVDELMNKYVQNERLCKEVRRIERYSDQLINGKKSDIFRAANAILYMKSHF